MEISWWINYSTNFKRAILHHHWNWILASKAKWGSQNSLSEKQKRRRWLGQKEMQWIITVWEIVHMTSPYVNMEKWRQVMQQKKHLKPQQWPQGSISQCWPQSYTHSEINSIKYPAGYCLLLKTIKYILIMFYPYLTSPSFSSLLLISRSMYFLSLLMK